MKLFGDVQKEQVQRLYTGVVTALRQRYGPGVIFEGVNFAANDTGNVVSMRVNVSIETPPDVDGATVRHRKQVEVWE